MNKDSVCVLIPTKNRRELLKRAIFSIFNQTVKPEEVIIINDGSTDDTKFFLEDISNKNTNFIIINREKSGGVNVARNQGIKRSKSEWIIFLDDDDELLPECVFIVKEKIKKIPGNYGISYFNSLVKKDGLLFNGGFQFDKINKENNFFDPSYNQIMIKYGLNGDPAVIFRRSVVDKFKFTEGVNGFESTTIKKIVKNGWKVRYHREVVKLINLNTDFEHLSFSASVKNPGHFFVLHLKEIFEHWKFYINNPVILIDKKITMVKLLVRVLIKFCRTFYKKTLRILGLQRWIRLGIRYRLILSQRYEDFDFIVPFFGYKYTGNLKDYIDRYVFYFGAYEREEMLFLKKFISKDSIILDIGANTGHHSLFFSRFAKKVYSFEPYQKLFYIFLDRIHKNGIQNIFINNFGLGKNNTEAEFFASTNYNEGVGSFIPSSNKVSVGNLIIKNGDEFVSNLDEKIDFIKIDVEGMEEDVLEGLNRTIMKDKPVMFIEMSPESQNKLSQDLKNIYNTYIIYANNPNFLIFNKPGCIIKIFEPQNTQENILFIPKDI